MKSIILLMFVFLTNTAFADCPLEAGETTQCEFEKMSLMAYLVA